MSQQTAVEWLKTEMEQYGDPEYLIIRWTDLDELINQSKQMEKEQIIKSNRDGVDMAIDKKRFITGEEYYNETFGNH